MITKIHEYIRQKLESGTTPQELSNMMGVSTAMVSKYKANKGYRPSLNVAKAVFIADRVALHPFAKESLLKELNELN